MPKIMFPLGLALAVAAAPALAEGGAWRVGNDQIHIVDSTIDTATPAGRAALLVRVEKAAARLCSNRVGLSRAACEAQTVRETASSASSWGRALATALQERGEPRFAAK